MKSCVTIALVPSIKTGPWIYWNDLETSMAKAAALGFDAVELFTPAADTVSSSQLTELMNQFGLKVAAVGTGAGKVLHGLTLTDPDPQIRTQAVAFIAAMMSFGATVGAPAIIGSMQGNVVPGVEKEQAMQWLADGLNTLGNHAETLGVKLIYEPLNRYETNLINDLSTGAEFIRSLQTSQVVLLADLFHMNIEEQSLPESIRAAGASIGHVHFADSNRRPIGLGHTAMDEVATALKEIGYTGYISAEAFPFPDPDQAARQTIQSYKAYFG
ncbi:MULTISPECIES: sugar phosphate isomerase/epimerase family protein [unclassified Spirosoma]|uniref:sugar phosphate isomerase/epimerase family protein n=1 Tax=unclassified Spirosoma TaxID=2621999 RepID=UPI000960D5B5|nr:MULTISPECIES: sugar phosphate isomerase/epimerase family protein [unclassified Spirosoma]MBN8825127.1 sugar phosphate isomerase/epimerase [Spirosoma sp.]OJW77182.1 MAG: sugar phosphate isomerase [Spirosoma sp. 48-14]